MRVERLYIIGSSVIIGLLGIIVLINFSAANSKKTATLVVQSVVPDDITVKIDGMGVSSTGSVKLLPGNHTLVATRTGFAGQTSSYTLKDHETQSVRLLLTPTGPEADDWIQAHPTQFLEFEAKTGSDYTKKSQRLSDKYPIISSLPQLTRRWRIDYGPSAKSPNDPNAIALTITYTGDAADKQDALDWMSSQGFNPDSYEIIYKTLHVTQ